MIHDKLRTVATAAAKPDVSTLFTLPSAVESAVWTGTKYVAVGADDVNKDRPKIVTSTDLTNWTRVTLPDAAIGTLYSIAWSGSVLVACGGGQVLRSTDGGTTWTRYTPGGGGYSVRWLNNQFVMAGGDKVYFSSDGITWTARTLAGTGFCFDVTWTGSVYIVVGDSAGAQTSPDGITWTARTTNVSTDENFISIVWDATVGRAVAVGTTGVIATTGSGGTTWAARTSGTTLTLYSVVRTSTNYVAAGAEGRVLYSSDGITWTLSTRVTRPTYSTIVWNGTNTVFFSKEGGILTSGAVGGTLTQVLGASAADLFGVNYTTKGFIATGGYYFDSNNYITVILTSNDGINWTYRNVEVLGQKLYGAAASSSIAVVVGSGGIIYSSTDLVTWTQRTSNTTNVLNSVSWSGTTFVAVGNSGTVRSSTNGTSWTSRTSGVTVGLNSIVWTGSLFVAVGDSGTIITSSDGITWTSRISGTTKGLYSVTAKNTEQIVAAGGLNGASVCVSNDGGLTWSLYEFSADSMSINSVVWAGNRYIAANQQDLYTSSDGVTWTKKFNNDYGVFKDITGSMAWSTTEERLVAVTDNIITPNIFYAE